MIQLIVTRGTFDKTYDQNQGKLHPSIRTKTKTQTVKRLAQQQLDKTNSYRCAIVLYAFGSLSNGSFNLVCTQVFV